MKKLIAQKAHSSWQRKLIAHSSLLKKAHSSWLIVLLILFAISYQLSAVSAFADDWSMGDWKNAELELVDGFENYVGNDWKNAELELIDGYDTTEEGYSQFYASLTSTVVPERAVDKTITFTRATTATFFDFEGLLKTAISGEARFEGARRVQNLLVSARSINISTWSKSGSPTFVTGKTDPTGGVSAVEMTATGTNDYVYVSSSGTVGFEYVFSCWIKRVSGTGDIKLSIAGAVADATLSVTTSWKRFSTFGVSTDATVYPKLTIATSGDVIEVAFLQLERVTGQANKNPSEFVSGGVLSAPYHGAGVDLVKYFTTYNGNTVASNVVTEATGAAISPSILRGYLSELLKTNKILYSSAFDDATSGATWAETNITPTANTAVSIDGSTSADTLTATDANGTELQSITGTATAWTFSAYIKRKTGTGAVSVTANSAAGYTACTINSSTWTRCTDTRTLTAAAYTQGVQIATSGDEIYISHAQGELGIATTPIPTVAAELARNGDRLIYQTSNMEETQGTVLVTVTSDLVITNGRFVHPSGTTEASYVSGGLLYIFDGTTSANAPNSFTAGKNIAGTSWGANGQVAVLNGGTVGTNSFDGIMNKSVSLDIGSYGGVAQPCVAHKDLYIWKRQLPNATLVTETTW